MRYIGFVSHFVSDLFIYFCIDSDLMVFFFVLTKIWIFVFDRYGLGIYSVSDFVIFVLTGLPLVIVGVSMGATRLEGYGNNKL